MSTAPTAIEQRQFGELADDVAYLRRGCNLLVAPYGVGWRVGRDVVDNEGLQARAKAERARRAELAERQPRPAAHPISTPPAPEPARPPQPDRPPVLPPAPAAKPLSGAAATAAATAREYSTDLGPLPRMDWIDKTQLRVDRRYQREIAQAGTAHVHRIRKGFRWSFCQPIIVTERDDGAYDVIDGQHRVEAALKHPLIDKLPAFIVDASSVAEAALVFSTVNGRRLSLTSLQKFWAAHAAGEESAVAVHEICQRHRVTILRNIPSYDIPARSVLAPFTLQKMLKRVGQPAVANAIRLLAKTHGETLNAFRSPTMVALATIAGGKDFSRDAWARVLKRLDLDKLYNDARADRVARGGTLETATERVLRKRAGKVAA